MDFNLDDPLADILSDGSNDSFFESSKKKKSTSLASLQPSNKSYENKSDKRIEDLFGVKEPELKPTNFNNTVVQKKNISEYVSKDKSIAAQYQADSNIFNDDDIVSDLGFDPKKPKSKISILDDLLAPIESRKQSSASLPISKSLVGSHKKMISRQSTETTETSAPGNYAPSLPTRPKTAGRKQSIGALNDPLGLFSLATTKDVPLQDAKESKETPKPKRKGSPANWLGIDTTDNQNSGKDNQIPFEIPTKVVSTPQILSTYLKSDDIQNLNFHHQPITVPSTPNVNQSTLLLATANFENENALQTLQHQEAQIIMASKMKNQELALMEIQKRQQVFLGQQETQFNDLLQKQISRQNQIEMSIRSQQERINAHIQLLMTQPTMALQSPNVERTKTKDRKKNLSYDNDEYEIDSIQLEMNVKRLEMEKLRLEDLIANMNANHEKELDFIEQSHKKQICVLEINLKSVEDRLQTELKFLEEFYNKKLENFENEKNAIIETFNAKISELLQDHEHSIKSVRLNHKNELEILKNDHRSMIESIRESKLLEFSIVQENSSYLETLRMASNNLENASGGLKTLRDEISIKIDLQCREKEQNLINREKKLEDSERRLKLMEESSETEKSRLIELVTTLEIQLSKLSKDSADEQWTIRQKLSSLNVERAAFEREIQFAREQLLHEEKRIEELKQYQLDENLRLQQQLQNKEQLLLIEKAKFETSKKLEISKDENKSSCEIEMSIKVAQEAIKQADLEREKFFRKQREIEARKRELIDQENEVRSKHDELESTIISIKTKEQLIQNRLQKNRLAEQNFNTKSQFLQNQIRQVAERESSISQERLILSQERLQLQEYKKKLELNKCSLCKIGERSFEISNILTNNHVQVDGNEIFNPSVQINSNFLMQNNAIDKLFDDDVSASLKRMEQLSINLNNDFNYNDNEVLDVNLHYLEPLT